jgi:tetratricopeptide (TPR) repeat protein
MSKKVKTASSTPKPQAAQIDAIRRLLAGGNPELAWSRVRQLRKCFPDFKPLLALSFEVAVTAEMEHEALLCAYDWATASPTNRDALEALMHSALRLNFGALGGDATLRLAALDDKIIDLPASLPTPFGDISHAEMVMADTGRILLNAKRFHDVVALLKNAAFPSLINNLGLAYFALGKLTLAADSFTQNWATFPGNLFAAERQIRTQLWLHGNEAIKSALPTLLENTPSRTEDALGKLSSLLLLQEWAQADIYWKASIQESYWDKESNTLQLDLLHYLGICIALRLDNIDQARQRLLPALESTASYPHLHELALYLALQSNASSAASLPNAPTCVAGEVLTWFPSTWLDQLSALNPLAKQLSSTQIEIKINAILLTCDAHHDYLAIALELGGKDTRNLAMEILKLRAKQNDTNAINTLTSLLTRPFGTDQDRFTLLRFLQDLQILDRATAIPMLLKGSVTEVRSEQIELSSEPTADSPYPKAGQAQYEKMHALLSAKKLEQALVIAQSIYQDYPKIAMSAANLAMIKESLQHPSEEIEALFQHAFSLNKDYLFARAGLARLLAKRGDPDAAQAILEPALSGKNFHMSEWRTLLFAQIEIAKARGDLAATMQLTRSLYELVDIE